MPGDFRKPKHDTALYKTLADTTDLIKKADSILISIFVA
jgi:hypothetical protein